MGPLAALYLDWAFTGLWPIVGKVALRYFDALTYSVFSLGGAFLVLLPFLIRNGQAGRLFERGLRGRLLCIGALGSGLTSFLYVTAVGRTTPANAAIVCQIEVVYSAALAGILLRERITGAQISGTALVIGGAGLILWNDLGTPHWGGDLIILGTPWMFQVSHILSKRLPKDLDHATIAAARLFYGAATLAPFAVLSALRGHARASFSTESVVLMAFQCAVMNALNATLWYMAIRSLELAKTTAIMLSYPALTMVYSRLLGQERIGLHQVEGLALSMTGALWLTLQMRGASQAQTPTSRRNPKAPPRACAGCDQGWRA